MGHIPTKFSSMKNRSGAASENRPYTDGATKGMKFKATVGGIPPSTSIKTGKTPKMPEAPSNNASLRAGSKGYKFVTRTA